MSGDEDYVYCYRGGHWPHRLRMLGEICVDCRADEKFRDEPPISALLSPVIFGQPKQRKIHKNAILDNPT